jgi:hypothetical protein
MKRLLLVATITGALAVSVASAQNAKTTDGLPPLQPPPAMDDPGPQPATAPVSTGNAKVVPLANSDAEAKEAVDEAKRRAAQPVPIQAPEPEKKFDSPGLPPEVQKAAEATQLPVVTVRQEGNETIEEYRSKGKIFAQHIISKETGAKKWYVDPAYRGPVPPDLNAGMHGTQGTVQYKVFGW